MAAELIGRHEELSSLTAFLEAIESGSSAFVVEGEAGIGKTTVWQAGVRAAELAGCRVLSCRPTGSEARFSFAALGDLLEPVLEEMLPRLPAVQRRALELALVLSEADDEPGRGAGRRARLFSACFEPLPRPGAVVVAVDDAQWLDQPTATVLEFAARRLREEPIGLLLARRSAGDEPPPLGLARALPDERLQRIRLGPLSLRELHELLFSRLQVDLHGADPAPPPRGLGRQSLLRARDRAGARPLRQRPHSGRNAARARDAARARSRPPCRRFPRVRGRRSSPPPRCRSRRSRLVEAALPRGAAASSSLASAVEADVIELRLGRIRFTHPLLASTLYADASPVRRRRLHRRLATVVADPEEKARHLALAAEGPDAEVASALDRAAVAARARGASEVAALLTEQARQLTPPARPVELWRRTMKAVEYSYEAGDSIRAHQLGKEAVALAPGSRDRANALNILARVNLYEDLALAVRLWEEALAEVDIDLATRAASQHGLAVAAWMRCTDLSAAADQARAAVESAAGLDSVALARALMVQAGIDGMRGEPGALALMERAAELDGQTQHSHVLRQSSHLMGFFLWWADRLEEFRASVEQLYERAVSEGDESSVPTLLTQRCIAEIPFGNLAEAKRLLEEAVATSPAGGEPYTWKLAVDARISGLLGLVDRARDAGERAVALAEEIGRNWPRLWALGALGFVELSLGHPAEAHEHLARAITSAEEAGIREPSECGFVIDDVEALIALGRVDDAAALLEPLEARSVAFDRPSARGGCARCRGLLLAARGDLPGALAALEEALEQHERVPRPFELARSLLALGVIERRAKKKAAARETLERALATFDRVGARLWAEKARTELGRIGGRAALPLGADPDRRAGRSPRRRRPHQSRGRRRAVHERSHGRLEPPQDLRQARRSLAPRARRARAPGRRRLTAPRQYRQFPPVSCQPRRSAYRSGGGGDGKGSLGYLPDARCVDCRLDFVCRHDACGSLGGGVGE